MSTPTATPATRRPVRRVHRNRRRDGGRRHGSGNEPGPGRRGPSLGIAQHAPRGARGGGALARPQLVGRGRPGAQRRRHRRHRHGRALQPRREHGRSACARRDPERGYERAGARIAPREDVGDGGDFEEPDGDPDRRGEGRRGVGLHRAARRRRLGDLARADNRVGGLGGGEGLRRPAPGERAVVAGLGGVTALLDGRPATASSRASRRAWGRT